MNLYKHNVYIIILKNALPGVHVHTHVFTKKCMYVTCNGWPPLMNVYYIQHSDTHVLMCIIKITLVILAQHDDSLILSPTLVGSSYFLYSTLITPHHCHMSKSNGNISSSPMFISFVVSLSCISFACLNLCFLNDKT